MSNLSQVLFDRNFKNSNKIAFVDETQSITYGELEVKSRKLASWLIQHGVGPGDRVCVALYDKVDTIIVFMSVVLIGAIAVMTNPRTKTDKLIYQINYNIKLK